MPDIILHHYWISPYGWVASASVRTSVHEIAIRTDPRPGPVVEHLLRQRCVVPLAA